jgi:hypothetical protein
MNIEDIKIGMSVYAEKKSAWPWSWDEFICKYPTQIADVHSIKISIHEKPIIELGSGLTYYKFYPEDLTEVKNGQPVNKNLYKVLKPITLKGISESGFSGDDSRKFLDKLLVWQDISISWKDIPVNLAQHIMIQLGFPDWLQNNGFIQVNSNLITHVYSEEDSTKFYIKIVDIYGRQWYALEIEKDGTGFYRNTGISDSVGFSLTNTKQIMEKNNEN